MTSSSKPAITPGLRRVGIAILGAGIAAASAVSKLLEGNQAELSWKELSCGAGVAIFTYCMRYRDDFSPEELDAAVDAAVEMAIRRWLPRYRDDEDEDTGPASLTEPA